jgi:hypothetical protein
LKFIEALSDKDFWKSLNLEARQMWHEELAFQVWIGERYGAGKGWPYQEPIRELKPRTPEDAPLVKANHEPGQSYCWGVFKWRNPLSNFFGTSFVGTPPSWDDLSWGEQNAFFCDMERFDAAEALEKADQAKPKRKQATAKQATAKAKKRQLQRERSRSTTASLDSLATAAANTAAITAASSAAITAASTGAIKVTNAAVIAAVSTGTFKVSITAVSTGTFKVSITAAERGFSSPILGCKRQLWNREVPPVRICYSQLRVPATCPPRHMIRGTVLLSSRRPDKGRGTGTTVPT